MTTLERWGVAVVVLVGLMMGSAAPAAQTADVQPVPFEEETLPNGLR